MICRKMFAARSRVALGQHLLAHRDQRLDLGLALLRLALDRQLGEDLVEASASAGLRSAPG